MSVFYSRSFTTFFQGSRSVEDYSNEFYQLLTRVVIHDSEDQLVARYIAGLRTQLQTMLHQFDPCSVTEARQRTLLVEQQNRSTANQWNNNSKSRNTATVSDDNKTSSGRDSTQSTKSNSRPADANGTGMEPRPSRPNALRCFTCGERDHIQTACPTLGRRGLITTERDIVEDPIYDEEEEEDDDFTEEQVSGDTGTFLRNCLAPKVNEAWQRTTFFSSTCTVKGKICRFVVDSGCSANVVSEEAVRKLALPVETHPHPYRLLWMQTGAEVFVSKRTLLSFSIGAHYKDTFHCDIAPMDVSHIILGRPWQYDREVIHNGKMNTHSFMFQGHKIMLLPSPDTDPVPADDKQQTTKQNLLIISKSQFEDELRAACPLFALVATDVSKEEHQVIPLDFKELISEFHDLFPTNLPAGSLPLRDIQHHIDLVPNAVLPNRAHYRMSPEEHEELRRQVEDLLTKGYVRECLSPCAVPALLIPKKDKTWRMCVDSRAINKITTRYRFPIPRLDDL